MSAVFKMGGGCPVGIRPIIWMILYKSSTAVRTSVVECRQFSEGTASDNDCWFSAQFGQKIRWRTGRQSNEIKHLNVCGKRFNFSYWWGRPRQLSRIIPVLSAAVTVELLSDSLVSDEASVAEVRVTFSQRLIEHAQVQVDSVAQKERDWRIDLQQRRHSLYGSYFWLTVCPFVNFPFTCVRV